MHNCEIYPATKQHEALCCMAVRQHVGLASPKGGEEESEQGSAAYKTSFACREQDREDTDCLTALLARDLIVSSVKQPTIIVGQIHNGGGGRDWSSTG
jgi:hypothetical protein